MDRTSRFVLIFSLVCLILLGISLFWNNPHWRPRIWQLNEVLEQDAILSDAPYRFRVLTFMGSTAILSSPRSSPETLPAVLAQLQSDPSLADLSLDDSALQMADGYLRRYESHAAEVMLAEPDVKSVRWMLDKAWYHRQGLALPPR